MGIGELPVSRLQFGKPLCALQGRLLPPPQGLQAVFQFGKLLERQLGFSLTAAVGQLLPRLVELLSGVVGLSGSLFAGIVPGRVARLLHALFRLPGRLGGLVG